MSDQAKALAERIVAELAPQTGLFDCPAESLAKVARMIDIQICESERAGYRCAMKCLENGEHRFYGRVT